MDYKLRSRSYCEDSYNNIQLVEQTVQSEDQFECDDLVYQSDGLEQSLAQVRDLDGSDKARSSITDEASVKDETLLTRASQSSLENKLESLRIIDCNYQQCQSTTEFHTTSDRVITEVLKNEQHEAADKTNGEYRKYRKKMGKKKAIQKTTRLASTSLVKALSQGSLYLMTGNSVRTKILRRIGKNQNIRAYKVLMH